MAKSQLLTHKYKRKMGVAKAKALRARSMRQARPFPMPTISADQLPNELEAAARKEKSKSSASAVEKTAPVRSKALRPGSPRTAASGLSFQPRVTEKVGQLDYPYSAIGKMFFTADDGRLFVGSGWIVGRNSFVTAAHCLYDSDADDFYDNITLTPAFGSPSSAERIPVVKSTVNRNYVDKSFPNNLRWDIGVAIVDADLVQDYGSLGYDASGNVASGELEALGYPLVSRPIRRSDNGNQRDPESIPFDGRKMWHSIGDYLGNDGDLHGMENEMTPGCSGGPMIIDDFVAVGLNSHHLVPHDNRMFSPIFDDDFRELINWLIENNAF